MEVVLAVDIGSSSVRCVAYSRKGADVTALDGVSSSVKIKSVEPNTGKIRLGETNSLLGCVDSCVDSVVKKLRGRSPFRIAGVGFSCFVMNWVAVDRDGQILGDDFSISYACNTPEVARECEVIREELGEAAAAELYQSTGAPIHSAYALAQLRVLYRKHPVAAERIFKWQTIPGLCLARWTGRTILPMSYSEASWTGLLNFKHCAYEFGATELLPRGCLGTLPPLADFHQAIPGFSHKRVGGIANTYWKKWPELRQAPLFLGIGDGACANIGSKCSTDSRIAVTIGTSAAARVCIQQGVGASCSTRVPSGLFCYRIDQHNLLLGGALTDGGSVIEWAAELLNLSSEKAFLHCVNQAEELTRIDYNGLPSKEPPVTMLPFLSGERSTGYRNGATGAVTGLTLATTPGHIFKACLESVSLRLRAIVNLIQDTIDTDAPPSILASGGALESNSLWRQMIADCSGLKVILDLDTTEGSSRGVARLISNALTPPTVTNQHHGPTTIHAPAAKLPEEEIIRFREATPKPRAVSYFQRAAAAQEAFLRTMSPLYMQPTIFKNGAW
jgi:gluconokinase